MPWLGYVRLWDVRKKWMKLELMDNECLKFSNWMTLEFVVGKYMLWNNNEDTEYFTEIQVFTIKNTFENHSKGFHPKCQVTNEGGI